MVAHKATIADSAATSNAVDMGTGTIIAIGLIIPALTTSVAVTFTVANKDTDTFVPLYDELGVAISVPASTSAARGVALPAHWLAGWRYIKCAVANNQTGAKDILVCVR